MEKSSSCEDAREDFIVDSFYFSLAESLETGVLIARSGTQ